MPLIPASATTLLIYRVCKWIVDVLKWHCSDVTRMSWRLKSTATQLFVLNFVQYSINENIKLHNSPFMRGLYPLQWRHNGLDCVSNHQPHDCLLNRLFRRRSKKTSKLRVTGLCAGNSPGTGEFPAQMASNAENVSIWWRHHAVTGLFAS